MNDVALRIYQEFFASILVEEIQKMYDKQARTTVPSGSVVRFKAGDHTLYVTVNVSDIND